LLIFYLAGGGLKEFPGVISARWTLGEGSEKALALLDLLKGVPDQLRTGRMVSVLSMVKAKDGDEILLRGECRIKIANSVHGKENSTLGYDVCVYPMLQDGSYSDRVFSEMGSAEKRLLSHRGAVIDKLKEVVLELKGETRRENIESKYNF
jgi:inosine/xanthosine triphosphate pyrophosphatase family protein